MLHHFRVLFMALFVLGSISFSQGAQAQQVKEWTFLVFLNADNNLYRYGDLNFAEMERVGSSSQVNIVVQFDPEPDNMPTKRYYVTKNPNSVPGKPTSPVVQTMGETDMGSAKTLAEFLVWGAKNYPAKKYAVVVWNHGAGWEGISYDDNPHNHMTTPELRTGLEVLNRFIAAQRGQQQSRASLVDLINFDACLMAAIEVGYELRNHAKVLVGSQFLEPAEGENYTTLLGPLIEKPTMTAAEFSQILVYQYVLRYKNGGDEINYIALDLSKLTNFTGAFNTMSQGILGTKPEIKRELIKGFNNPSYGGFDLIGVMKKSQSVAKEDPSLSKLLEGLVQMYGYPEDPLQTVRTQQGPQRGFNVVRYSPGVVHYRTSAQGSWADKELVAAGDGTYRAMIPATAPMQYVVSQRNFRGQGPMRHEAVSTVMRAGQDPIVFHNKFPASSPVIADAHNKETKGAYGMSLYSLAGLQAAKKGNPRLAGSILDEYKKLQFATTGAPAWTQVFGF
jgi:hypothetical protein